jgi:hypothetical protein
MTQGIYLFYGKRSFNFKKARRTQNEPEAGISPVIKRIRDLKIPQ